MEELCDCSMENNIIDDLVNNFESKLEINKKYNSKKYIIVIDNDECIGSWGDLSLLYTMIKNENLLYESNLDLFVDIMIKTGCIRPYVKNFFEKLLDLKMKNIVDKIIMFTAASNSTGWVLFLSKILERWIGCKIYDEIIFQEMIYEWHITNNSDVCNSNGYIKNMNMIRELIILKYKQNPQNYDIIAIDDRPSNILNGIAIGVRPYNVAVNIFEVLRIFLPEKFEYLIAKYEKSINQKWENYMKNPHLYTKAYLDRDIFIGIENIDKIIFSDDLLL
jgi:hypothetical protein